MSQAPALDAPTERVAVNLLRHLEWQDEGFSLIFLFADVGPSLQLANWLDQRLSVQGRPLQRHEAKDSFVRNPEAEVDALVAQFEKLSGQPGGVWYAVQRHPGDAQWNKARTLFLARLNERRFLLERDLKRPLILVLPAHFRAEARAIAPDIWHKRDMSEELRSAPAEAPERQPRPLTTVPTPAAAETSLTAFGEWQRMAAGSSPDRVFLPTAWKAATELLAAGRPADAENVAVTTLSLARRRAATPDAATLRDLALSLDNLGRVAETQGDWIQAQQLYTESLALSRQLVERLGGTPEALRDLSVSLNNLGRVARAQGDWNQAQQAYAESLALRRQLVERLGGTPEALRDLSVSLNNVGRVAEVQGDWPQADQVYAEGLALRRQLVERLGGTPEALRDLSVSLNNLGRVAQAQGDWTQAHQVYAESLALSRQLVGRLGGTPEAPRNLSVSLDNLGRVAEVQGDWTQAHQVYAESLALSRQLVERLGGTPEALRDLSISLDNLGRVAQALGDWTQAQQVYAESLALRRQLVERLGGTPESLDDLAVSLLNLAGKPGGDAAARAEAIEVYRQLATRFPDTARYAQRLAALTTENDETPPEAAQITLE